MKCPRSDWHVCALLVEAPWGFSVKFPCLNHRKVIYGIPEALSHGMDLVSLSPGNPGFRCDMRVEFWLNLSVTIRRSVTQNRPPWFAIGDHIRCTLLAYDASELLTVICSDARQ